MPMEDGEENVGVGGEDHQQSNDHIHTRKRGKDAFMHAGVQPQQDPRDTLRMNGIGEREIEDT